MLDVKMKIPNNLITRYGVTKQGNTYEKQNSGKRIGSAAGLFAGSALCFQHNIKLGALLNSIRFIGHQKLGYYGYLGAVIVGATIVGRVLGSIPDFFINRKRITEADNKNQQ